MLKPREYDEPKPKPSRITLLLADLDARSKGGDADARQQASDLRRRMLGTPRTLQWFDRAVREQRA